MTHRPDKLVLLVPLIVLSLSGCSTSGDGRIQARRQLFDVSQMPSAKSMPGRAVGGDVCKNPTAADLDALRQRFDKTLSGCSTVLSGYQDEAKRSQRTLAGLAIVGTMAGSVIVPSLVAKATFSKSAVAAWSGLAGATNFAQHALVNEGLGPGDLIKVREGIRGNLSQAIDKFTNTGSDYCAREDALASMAAACINYELFVPGQVINESPPLVRSDQGDGNGAKKPSEPNTPPVEPPASAPTGAPFPTAP